jgi:hypothetical protein
MSQVPLWSATSSGGSDLHLDSQGFDIARSRHEEVQRHESQDGGLSLITILLFLSSEASLVNLIRKMY